MAIKLTATLVDSFGYISLHDEAIDAEREDFADLFRKYREGTEPLPPLKAGAEPTVWTLRPIADARLLAILDGVREEHGRAAWAVGTAAFGIESVSGLSDESGKAYKLRRIRQDGYERICDEQLNEIGAPILNELGMAILTHNSPS